MKLQGKPNLENTIVLAMAIRLGAERYMISKIKDDKFVAGIAENQTQILIKRFKSDFAADKEAIRIFDMVSLITPENIHVNSFMYEPILDMSDDHLRKLYTEISALKI